MKIRGFLIFALAALVAALSSPGFAALDNYGFEAGTNSWDFAIPGGGSGGAGVDHRDGSSSWWVSDFGNTYQAQEGTAYLDLHPDGPGNWTVAAQTAGFDASERVAGRATFDSWDYRRLADYTSDASGTYGNDRAKVEIYTGAWTAQQIKSGAAAGSLLVTPWERSVFDDGTQVGLDYAVVGNFGDDSWVNWTEWNYTFGAKADYTVAYKVTSGLMGANLTAENVSYKSHAFFDGSPYGPGGYIPEAGTSALMGLGLVALLGYFRRRSVRPPR